MDHLISIDQFNKELVLDIIQFMAYKPVGGNDKIMASLFFEPSTRTRLSFESAMHRIGGKVISISDKEASSITKGETLEDTIRTVSMYSDIIVLRHPAIGAAERAAKVSNVPIINAGDGSGEHPTQALLDAKTIYSKFKRLDDLTILFAGDIKYSRTVHSLLKLMNMFDNVRVIFVPFARCDASINSLVTSPKFSETNHYYDDDHKVNMLDIALQRHYPDVVYMTRLQLERWTAIEYPLERELWFNKDNWNYKLCQKHLDMLPKSSIIMHALPKVNEISPEVDVDPRAVYFTRQLSSGLSIRESILFRMLGFYEF